LRVEAIGLGPVAAARSTREALARGSLGRALLVGLCGLTSPAFVPGDILVYGTIRTLERAPLACDPDLSRAVAGAVPGSQSGIRALGVAAVVTSAHEKRALGERFGVQAVDMESFDVLEILRANGVPAAVLRVASDGIDDDLPDFGSAIDAEGNLDQTGVARAMLARPLAGLRMAAGGLRALAALERAVSLLAVHAPAAGDAGS
jgi:nucleoside phosphorylase